MADPIYRKELEMSEEPITVKEYEERTLNAGRMYYLLRRELETEDPWHIIVLAICSFEKMHVKDGWEFVLTNQQDIEDIGRLFERSNNPQEFREGLIELKEKDLMERLQKRGLK